MTKYYYSEDKRATNEERPQGGLENTTEDNNQYSSIITKEPVGVAPLPHEVHGPCERSRCIEVA